MPDKLILSSDSHVFEPPDLWTNRIDDAFKSRAPRMERVGDVDHLVIEDGQMIAGIGLISNAGARYEAPETIADHARFEDVHQGGYEPSQHLKDMVIDGVYGEVLYPSQGLFYFKVADPLLFSAICRTYNDWLAEFCSADRDRLKAIAMINADDVADAVSELERTAKLGFSGAMIAEYPIESRRYDHPDYEPLWAAAASLDLPLSLHTATRRVQSNSALGERSVQDASRRSTKVFLPALSMCDMIFAGVFERHPKLRLAIVEFELSWLPYVLTNMDYTYRERNQEALFRFKGDTVPSDFVAQNVYLSFQEDQDGISMR
ncbi:MAG: amidohydrolase family protein, partial [Pseudomonadota bacterium]|nr:amidohydrolase family protein [Pseudomonadota bacterium]